MAETVTVTRLLTDKADPGVTELVAADEPATVADGELLLALDLFSLTANNITYAVFGETMNYWDFFPTGREGRGHMPVWGFADVVASGVDGIAPGERFYGYYPIASLVRLRAERVSDRGFHDGSEYRQALAPVYNQYTRCGTDPAYAPEREGLQALYRPLFGTAFVLADFLADNSFFGARRVVFSSASAKTAYSTAHCLTADGSVELMALTSPGNSDFVRGLGCYEATVVYDDLETISADTPNLYVDFSGSRVLRSRVHSHFGAALAYDCVVGATTSGPTGRDRDLPGPAPVFFFAPTQLKKRRADWGPVELGRRVDEALVGFYDHLAKADPAWVHVVEGQGFAAAGAVIKELAGGGSDPAIGHVIRLG